MAKRYGRNQRRAHREQIALLETHLSKAKQEESAARSSAWHARIEASNAREIALRELVNREDMIKACMSEVGYELARTMGPHYKEHIEKLLAADVRRRPLALVNFDAVIPYDKAFKVSYIEGRIDALAYRVAVTDF
jgi:hypothetical protein